MALVGNMIASALGGNPSIVNYCIFLAVLSMLSLIYLFAVEFNEAFMIHPILPLAVDGINTLLFLIGGIALAAELGTHSCGNAVSADLSWCFHAEQFLTPIQGYINTNNVTSGSYNNTKRCHEAQASCAFIWFAFASYACSLVFSVLEARGGGSVRSSGIRRGGPSMSQV